MMHEKEEKNPRWIILQKKRGGIKQILEEAVQAGHLNLLVSFEGLETVDIEILSTLVQTQKELREKGGNISILCANQTVCKIFFVTGLNSIFKIFKNREEALKAMNPPLTDCLNCAVFCGLPNCPIIKSLAYPAPPCKPSESLPFLHPLQKQSFEEIKKRRKALREVKLLKPFSQKKGGL
jgi:anti-anti-sigma factor